MSAYVNSRTGQLECLLPCPARDRRGTKAKKAEFKRVNRYGAEDPQGEHLRCESCRRHYPADAKPGAAPNGHSWRGITEEELRRLDQVTRWGSDAYEVEKRGREWWAGPCPSPFRTKHEAVAYYERYLDVLRAAAAGRL